MVRVPCPEIGQQLGRFSRAAGSFDHGDGVEVALNRQLRVRIQRLQAQQVGNRRIDVASGFAGLALLVHGSQQSLFHPAALIRLQRCVQHLLIGHLRADEVVQLESAVAENQQRCPGKLRIQIRPGAHQVVRQIHSLAELSQLEQAVRGRRLNRRRARIRGKQHGELDLCIDLQPLPDFQLFGRCAAHQLVQAENGRVACLVRLREIDVLMHHGLECRHRLAVLLGLGVDLAEQEVVLGRARVLREGDHHLLVPVQPPAGSHGAYRSRAPPRERASQAPPDTRAGSAGSSA